ncbi:MAG: GEVED domain-containing protein [Planctomycetota bacterium]
MATQFDLAASLANGEPTAIGAGPTATGVVDTFVTGADGNYYFDVEATPAPPTLLDCLLLIPDFDPTVGPTAAQLAAAEAHFQVAFTQWFNSFGGSTFTYDISIVSDDASRIITNGGEGYFNAFNPGAIGSSVTFDGSSSYAVNIFADDFANLGETAKITNVNFLLEVDPALTNATVEGTVFRDRNGNGVQDAGIDEGLEGVTVFQDTNTNGVLDGGELSTVTGADGTYSFVVSGLLSNTDIVVAIENTPGDLVTANPASGFQTITAIPGATTGADFTLRLATGEPAIVLGSVFDDVNANGVRDNGEMPFSDTVLVGGVETPVIAYVDLDANGVRDETDPSAAIRADGTFLIETSASGPAEVRIELPSDTLTQTTPGSGEGVMVTLVAGQQNELIDAFGVLDGRVFDYGDLFVDPSVGANYPTLLADDGARHVVIPGMRLGLQNDVDDDGFQNPTRNPSLDGLGDDFSNVDDEDGVVIASGEFVPGSSLQFDIEAYGQGAVLNAWIDFNGNGQWESHEQVFTNLADIAFGPNGEAPSATIPAITVPDARQMDDADDASFLNTDADFFAARFRWGPFGLTPSGPANAGEVEDYLFAATPPIVITGAVRDDTADGDGVFDPTDIGVEGIRVFYDIDVDGEVDFDEPRAVTDANGEYRLEINTGTDLDVTIRIDTTTVPLGLDFVSPPDGIFNQNIDVSEQVESNYLLGAPQGLTGNVFSDADSDAVRDAGETGFEGIIVQVFQDADNNGSFETLVNSTTTDSNGDYVIGIQAVDEYQVRLDLSAPAAQFLTQTLPGGSGARTVTAVAGTFTAVPDFGVFDAVPTFILDYGDLAVDATRNFPTTLAQNGARHLITPGVFLGAGLPDGDPGTLQSADATADDLLFTPDDEDGVQLRTNIAADSIVRIDVTATGSSANRLHAWIDFNNDGDWDDAGERITSAGGNTLPSGQTSQLVIDTTGIDVDATATAYAARFRWGQGITGFDGPASTGEVEDYLLPRSLTPTSVDPLASDFNGDGSVDLLDLDILGGNFGTGPGATKAQGDANGDGNVDLLDLDILGSEFGSVASSSIALATASDEDESAGPQIALATASIDPPGVPPLVLHPVVEDVLEPVVLDADAFAPMLLSNPTAESAIDESLAVDAASPEADDALDAALLEWSLAGVVHADDEGVSITGNEESETEEIEESDELLAQVFDF